MHLRAPKISKFSGGACPQTPLGGAALRRLPTGSDKTFSTPKPKILSTALYQDLSPGVGICAMSFGIVSVISAHMSIFIQRSLLIPYLQ
jgi:hypothetical protein